MTAPQHHHHHHHQTLGPDGDDALAELLDLDGLVHGAYLAEAIAWVAHRAGDLPARRIVDLGCGTGTATVALANAFPTANVLAVDNSDNHLARVRAKAEATGTADRIVTVRTDLDDPWPIDERVDVVWASLSLHHLAEPDRVLTDLVAALSPGGLIAVAEMEMLPRFLPDDLGLGRPGLEARLHATLAEEAKRHLPTLGSDWGARLADVGFVSVVARNFTLDADPPLPAATGAYARMFFQRLRSQLDGAIDADDLDTLDALIDDGGPHSVLHRHDLSGPRCPDHLAGHGAHSWLNSRLMEQGQRTPCATRSRLGRGARSLVAGPEVGDPKRHPAHMSDLGNHRSAA